MKMHFEAKKVGVDQIAHAFHKHIVAEDGTKFRFYAFQFGNEIISLVYALESPEYTVKAHLTVD